MNVDCCYYRPGNWPDLTSVSTSTTDWRIVTYPSGEPITIEEARQHLRIDTYGSPPAHPDDGLIMMQLAAAREYCERYLGYSVAQHTVEMALDSFTEDIELPLGPVLSIQSLTYIDEDDDEITLDPADYSLDVFASNPWRLTSVNDWPTALGDASHPIRITYLTGYSSGSPSNNPLPAAIRAAILLVLGSLYEQREDSSEVKQESIPLGVAALLDFFRVRKGFA